MLPQNYQCEGQMTVFDFLPQPQSTKTCPERLVVESQKEQISDASSKNWQELKTHKFQYLCLINGCHRDVSRVVIGLLHGEPTMHSIGEFPKDAEESASLQDSTIPMQPTSYFNCSEKPTVPRPTKLSQVLEENPDKKYWLSPKACLGILRRAENRGKKLPELLERTLKRQSGLSVSKSELENPGGVKESLSKTTESDQWEQAPTNTLSASEVYGISPYDSNAMKSHNPDSGIYKADTSRTLDPNGGNPACNQGGMVVIEHAVCIGGGMVNDAVCPSDEVCKCLNCMDDTMKVVVEPVCVGNGQLAQVRLQDTVGTLNCMHDQQAMIAPVLAFDRAAYNQGMNAQYDFSIEEELAQTIVAKGPGGVMQTQ